MNNKLSLLTAFLLVTILPKADCQIHLWGELSGVLEGDTTYYIDGDISVENGDTLIIQAGAEVVFTGNYSFDIYGLLLALGEADEQVQFHINTAVPWQGIRFHSQADDSCRMEYCIITDAQSERGGAFYFYNCQIALVNCLIYNNTASEDGGGIYCANNSHLTLQDCQIVVNEALDDGGGIYCSNSQIIMNDCIIDLNSAGGQGGGLFCGNNSYIEFTGDIKQNYASDEGGGFACFDSYLIYNGNDEAELESNWTSVYGGGFYSASNSHLEIAKVSILGNQSPTNGGAFYCSSSYLEMINCTVCGNYTGASGAAIKLSNCDSASIINTIIHYYGSQYGIHFLNSAQSQIAFCDIFNFDGSNFTGTTPPGLGQIITTNYNGDLCDVYYNIFLNPLFVSFPNPANLHLQFNSPCIDAGNPLTPFDPDNTIADIGAFYYHQGIGIISNPPADILPKVLLYPPYPNPFNSSATIIFEATSATYVSLTLSNILGAELILFKEGFLPAGAYKFYVEGDYLANGLYFIQLRTKEGVYRHKLVHIK